MHLNDESYVLTPLARADIFEIWSYIADDSEEIADRVEQAIYNACLFLAEAPKAAIFAATLQISQSVFGRSPRVQITFSCTAQMLRRSNRRRAAWKTQSYARAEGAHLNYFFCSGLNRFPPGIGGQPSDAPSINTTAFS